MLDNAILATDSYKLGHHAQYPKNTEGVYSYLEARHGAAYDKTVFFGLQSILKQIEGQAFTGRELEEAFQIAKVHFGDAKLFNYKGWSGVLARHEGRLPIRIKAVPEGSVVPTGNVLMTVENTDPEAFWLTNAMESFLLHVWYPTTVASRSRAVKALLAEKLTAAGASLDGLPFMLHDFGYRGATTHDAAAIGGAGHLVNFVGTDTLPAMLLAMRDYNADLTTLGFSVPATEHSVMTALGRKGEFAVVGQLLEDHPTGILSVVADSYNIYDFVRSLGLPGFKETILARDGVFVVRPDSTTAEHPTPHLLVEWILRQLEADFGSTPNQKGYKVLNPKVRVLWGDGIDPLGIEKIINGAMAAGFSPENLVFGMGGGLLQKLDRDTQRFAFKSSAQKRDGTWHDVYKEPLDATKASMRGRLQLVVTGSGYATVPEGSLAPGVPDNLVTVFEDGKLLNETTFDQIRARAAL